MIAPVAADTFRSAVLGVADKLIDHYDGNIADAIEFAHFSVLASDTDQERICWRAIVRELRDRHADKYPV